MTSMYKIFAAIVLVVGIGVFSQGSVLADSANVYDHTTNYGDGCTNGGTMMNAALFIAYVDADSGKLIRYSNNMSVRVTSDYSNLTDHNGYSTKGIVKNYSESDMAWDDDKIFTTGTQAGNFENCEVPKAIETYLGEPDSSPNLSRHALVFEGGESTATTNADWQLNCGVTAIGIAEAKASGDQYPASRSFTFTGDSVNDIPAGYTGVGWGTQTGTLSPRADMNYINYTIVLTYRVREVRSATVTPWAEASSTINVGESFTYRNGVDVSDKVGTGGTFNWAITGPGAASGSGALDNGRRVDSSSGSIYYGQRSPAGGYTRQICASAGSTWATYNACASQTLTVNGWNLEASTTRSAASINVGTVGSFTHSIKNVGLAPTHVFIDVDMAGVGGADNTSMDIGWPAGTPSLANGDTKTSAVRTFTPDVRGTGATYCDGITATPKADNDSASATSSACIDVIGWNIGYGVSVKTPDGTATNGYVVKGTDVTFNSWVCNNGPAPTHKVVNGSITVPGDPVDTTTLDLPIGTAVGAANCKNKNVLKTMSNVGEYCQSISVTPIADNDSGPGTSSSCVYVIDPIPDAPGYDEYEKGSAGISLDFGINIDNGGAAVCPVGTAVTINWTYAIGAPINVNQSDTFTYGNGSCLTRDSAVVTFNATQKGLLNDSDPGTSYPTTVTVNSISDSGSFGVIEVPFTRFYGNDIYATSGDVRFNDSYNTDAGYDDRGAVSQFAAISSGAVQIDTSAFRILNSTQPTQPTNGLDSPGSLIQTNLKAVNSTMVYNDVIANLPDCPNTTNGNVITPPMTGCYRLSDDMSMGIPRLGGAVNPLTYNKKITIVANQDASKPLMIDRNIINDTADYTDIANVAVLLIVSAGDIYIDNDVQRIDAILVSGKDIYTCANSSSPIYGLYNNNQLHQSCRQTLTINGAMSAKNIHFLRAIGSRLLSTPTVYNDLANGYQKCGNWGGVKNCNVRNFGTNTNTNNSGPTVPSPVEQNNSGGAAEIVNFPAYLYFASPYLRDTAESGYESNALFQAPPRL